MAQFRLTTPARSKGRHAGSGTGSALVNSFNIITEQECVLYSGSLAVGRISIEEGELVIVGLGSYQVTEDA